VAWFWTDDLARALIDAGEVERVSVTRWMERPIAVAAPEDADPLEVGRATLGIASAIGAA
jgi:hypothetical protein